MSVVSTISETRQARASEHDSGSSRRQSGGAVWWVVLLLLWGLATAILALGANAVISFGG